MGLISKASDSYALVGDVGGTNARFAIASHVDGRVELASRVDSPLAEHSGLGPALSTYLAGLQVKPRVGAIAVAGPVKNGAVSMTNAGWRITEAELERELGLERVRLLNDFEAQAWGVSDVKTSDLLHLGGPAAGSDGPVAILGPGTGLGVAAFTRVGETGWAMVGEGGHVGFAPSDEVEDAILSVLRRKFGRVSIERLLSGPGLEGLHMALAEVEGRAPDPISAPELTARGLSGDTLCAQTLERFCAILGGVAGDLALTLGAKGGVFLTGGIAPRLRAVLLSGGFRQRFDEKGRFAAWMSDVPTWLILSDTTPLVGAAQWLESGRFQDDF